MPKSSPLAAKLAGTKRRHDNTNPLWKGPSGAGPLGGITQSMLVRFLSCRERFRLRYVLGLEPPDKWNKNTGYGNMWHVCEEALAAGWSNGANLQVLSEYAQEQLFAYPLQREEIEKWYKVCCVQFPEYIKHRSTHPDVPNRTPLMQEQVFDVPYQLPSGRTVRLRGKFDSVDLIDGGIWLQENKTKGDIDKAQVERQLRFDLQTMMYLVALQWEKTFVWDCEAHDAPPGHSPQIMGVRYNVIRRPLSGGIGNIRPHAAKTTKTKFTPAETEEEFYERLRRDYIAADPDYWFFRVRAEVSARNIQVFRDTCLDPLLEQVCCWYEQTTGELVFDSETQYVPPFNYRTPFGVWSALEEGGSTEYDAYLETGSESGLRRTEMLFTELQ